MTKFYLVNEEQVCFPPPRYMLGPEKNSSRATFACTDFKAALTFPPVNLDNNPSEYRERLCDKQTELSTIDKWDCRIELILREIKQDDTKAGATCETELLLACKEPFFTALDLDSFAGLLQVEIYFELGNSEVSEERFNVKRPIVTKEIAIQPSAVLRWVDYTYSAAIAAFLKTHRLRTKAKVNVILISTTQPSTVSCFTSSKRKSEESCEQIPEIVIRASNGTQAKCAVDLLVGHSQKFKVLIEKNKTRVIELPRMSPDGVVAFVDFLQQGDQSKPEVSCPIALELLEAGHNYGIWFMENAMFKLFTSRPDAWYDLDVAVRLFLFVQNLRIPGKFDVLKKKAGTIMKKHISDLEKSATYRQLTNNNPSAALGIYE